MTWQFFGTLIPRLRRAGNPHPEAAGRTEGGGELGASFWREPSGRAGMLTWQRVFRYADVAPALGPAAAAPPQAAFLTRLHLPRGADVLRC